VRGRERRLLLSAHRSRLVDQNRSAFNLEAVKLLNRFFGGGVFLHRHEAEALGATGVFVADDNGVLYLTNFGKDLLQIIPSRCPGEVADVQFCANGVSPPLEAGNR